MCLVVLISSRSLSSSLTGAATGLVAVSSFIDDPLVRIILIGAGSLCATLSIYIQQDDISNGSEDSPEDNESYMQGLREGVTLGKEITEAGGSIPPTLQSDDDDTDKEPEYEYE